MLLGQAVSPTIADALAWGAHGATRRHLRFRPATSPRESAPRRPLLPGGDPATAVPIAHEVIRVADGAPVMRHVLAWSDATRRSSLSGRGDTAVVRWAEGVEGAVRAAGAHVERHRPRRHARIDLITWRRLARVLLRAWESPQDVDPVAASLLGPWRDAGVEPRVGWYGATRSERLARALRRHAALRCNRHSRAPWAQKAAARARAAALRVADDWSVL